MPTYSSNSFADEPASCVSFAKLLDGINNQSYCTLVQVRLSVIVILNLIQEPDEDTLKLTTRPFLLPPRLNPFPPFPFSSPFTFLSSANFTSC